MDTVRRRFNTLIFEWKQSERFTWEAALACLAGAALLYPLVRLLPVVGWDWYFWFYKGNIDFYPPWTRLVLDPLVALPWREGLAVVNSIMLVSVAIATAREDRQGTLWTRLAAALLALLTPATFMNLWLGNIEGLALLGWVLFPPGVALWLMKPHLTAWAALARRSWTLWAAGLGLLSLLVWGWWPARTYAEIGRLAENPMMIGWHNLGWPVGVLGLVLLVLSNANPWRLMAAGFLVTPYLMPNHMLLLTPALGQVRGWRRLAMWGAAWVAGIASGVESGPARYLGLVFPLAVWWLLKAENKP